ncbi:MAG: deoxyribodipyrimidine photo-lyase [Bryobacteraceae bacterium]|nr:deoxyribodipyrimidine photo-lyase [Bryobacteraceae bacterium]
MVRRVRPLNSHVPRAGAGYVLYWAQMNRRVDSNHALAHAAALANELALPVLYYEGLTCSYPFANDRFHTFVLEGVPETARRLAELGIGYVFHLRRRHGDPNDALYKLAANAAAIVTDDYPAFIARRHNLSVPGRVGIPYIAVDSSCVVPMEMMPKREYAAYTIRPKIQRLLPQFLVPAPEVRVQRRYQAAAPDFHTQVTEDNISTLVAACEIDHSVGASIGFRGGAAAAQNTLKLFLERKLRRYARERNEPSAHATSDISPYLHFGQISALQVALAARAYAQQHQLIAEEFLEELIVRRELAFNFARFSTDPESLDNLPNWALETLSRHDADKRDYLYTREQFEHAATHDTLWNAAQKELLLRGKIHGYYRMYWGKKIIEWSPCHRDALETMIYLHDRYALDGRDPNTYTNILWCFGLHDRPWSERPVFGMIRYMSYDGMKRKTDVEAYRREIEYLERTGKDPFRLQ